MNTRHTFSRCLVFCLLLAWTTSSFGTSHAQAREQDQFSTWVWNPWSLRASSDDLLTFAVSNKISTLYLQIDAEMEISDYTTFIRKASAKQIQVYALDGAPAWATDRSLPQAFVNWLSAYQASAKKDEKFAGIHIDVEPYLLPQWESDREALLRSWKSSTQIILQGAKSLSLRAEADIPFWFHEHQMPDENRTLSSWMIDRFDGVTIMAYRDSGAQIIEVAKTQLAEAEKLGKPLRIAVETNPSSETPQVTFYEEGAPFLNSQLETVRQALGSSPSFAGFAVHDYEGWKKLQKASVAKSVQPSKNQASQTGAAVKSSKKIRTSLPKATARKK
ncbi:hypothetical protein [Saccharibacillus sp. JS10]|uniref:hypothetical protein n=1 Tax=Saccharibacillus sp. JS10 TaxID=2950552 RepID=UPI00210A78A6|nr:hypothetical protein [Saccharibacillus sp. JS10]MCQ4088213.1 hypothetical protein [Saccharibacillus sp. JS10]